MRGGAGGDWRNETHEVGYAEPPVGWLMKRLAEFGTVRGKGLMLGLEIGNAVPIVEKLLRRGVLALPEGNRSEILGVTPPLVITERQLEYCVGVLTELSI